MNKGVVVIDYGMGNIFSVGKLVERLGHQYQISGDREVILKADKIILPGVGHFGKAMSNLQKTNLVETLHEVALVQKKPVLGICLGMQLMASFSEEGDAEGLGWFDARVNRFQIQNEGLYKVPHMGWNTLMSHKPNAAVLEGVSADAPFYFVHSYHVEVQNASDVLTTTPYETTFVSAIQKENLIGVQFHPEKSHEAGQQLIQNFLAQ